MNAIFDIGNVLLSFQPLPYLRALLGDERAVPRVHEIVFQSAEWLMLDRGTITQEQAFALFARRAPELTSEIYAVRDSWFELLTPLADSVRWVEHLASRGVPIYYLSNFHARSGAYILKTHRFFDLFRGGVLSCDVHSIKPEREIYRHLLRKYALAPGECVFFDDMRANVDAAVAEGMRGAVFTDVKNAQAAFDAACAGESR